MATTNFLQWNPNAANQESDATYGSDSQRSGGAGVGSIFASVLANKLFYQLSIFVTALATALRNKGYTTTDGATSPSTALAALTAVLANLVTNADLQNSGAPYGGAFFSNASLQASSTSTNPPVTDSSTRIATTSFVNSQHYVTGEVAPQRLQGGTNGGSTSVTFPHAFSNTPVVALGMTNGTANIVSGSISTTGFSLNLSAGGQIVNWIAVGNL